ncbi:MULTISPECIES: trimeric intracellular cation channel family protein [Bacillaceae]|uniref:trimeric intracellular cation channel family protein n=1 Tax=Bacillaceae TaxID=186817 RepID=UPI001E5EE3F6|nr:MULTISPECIES: trimeric intracellular cation channel family protein [Bacillaceae]MCE4051449.1 trimeric intracellular cation channel family protein [Bacillus sp. Au-Bac7]MCM3033510.1 trimeric intracellular cation channel family protein [Niallia sp. MER 6]UPO89936.1 trimeric intracellular cation channel family protein [Niallia sp. Man26]
MSWDIWNYLGTIAFAISGALIASEEDYDLIGYYALGFITAFGGGAIRNLLIGVPVSALWEQNTLFLLTFLLITVIYFIPIQKIVSWKHWYYSFGLTDAVGLVAFAIQGALYAKNSGLPASASIASALLTGVGGGIIRDALAKRQPFVFKYELYAFWTIITGALIGLNFINGTIETYVLFIVIVVLRMLSLKYKWHIPRPKRQASNTEKAI